jgi:hypothetical protein
VDEETVIQLNNIGPWVITYIDPKDDPAPGAKVGVPTCPTSTRSASGEFRIGGEVPAGPWRPTIWPSSNSQPEYAWTALTPTVT